MGTNYYFTRAGKEGEPLHIGKSAGGWCFALHIEPAQGIHSLDDWRRLWAEPGGVIANEYKDIVLPDVMWRIITEREWKPRGERSPMGYDSWDDFDRRNHSVAGPNGLHRHAIGDRCIAHGAGTWDLLTGEFS